MWRGFLIEARTKEREAVGALFYRLNRHNIGDISISRWIQIFLLVPAAIAIVGRPNGYLIVAGGLLVLFIAFTITATRWRRRNYVEFTPQTAPEVTPHALQPSEKLPVFASGLFSVEGKYADFTWLQGYFRTFATREHALICLVQPSRFALLGNWAEKEVGRWYIFIKDDEVKGIHWGEIGYDSKRLPCIAVDHVLFVPKRGRFDRDKTLERTVYIACEDPADLERILADLHYRRSEKTENAPVHQNGAGKLPQNSGEWKRIDG